MKTDLWNKIVSFDLDGSMCEYGFSTRLAYENDWTRHFTEAAILEYKKFMYLAATSNVMVAPSKIVDVVWHQHLIFTQSYGEFCSILGKQIHHVPSTLDPEEAEKFRRAKEQTKKQYQSTFGEQPYTIWGYSSMLESLQLSKSSTQLSSRILMTIFCFCVLCIPFQMLMAPVYRQIENPYFMFGFFVLTLGTFLRLDFYNQRHIREIVNQFDSQSYMFHLHPFELVYLKKQRLSDVINGVVNEQIHLSRVHIHSDHTLELVEPIIPQSLEEFQLKEVFESTGKTFYPALLKQLVEKPIFSTFANSMNNFKISFRESKEFGAVFQFNLIVMAALYMLGVGRLITGFLSSKPIDLLCMVMIALLVINIVYGQYLLTMVNKVTVPNLYEEEIIPSRQSERSWEWDYYLGTAVLAAAFVPIVGYVDKNDGSSGSCGSSCGSSCGGSCGGGSCGGCGGGD
jgi:hypothetical protein